MQVFAFQSFFISWSNSLLKEKLGTSSLNLWLVFSCQCVSLEMLLVVVFYLNSYLKKKIMTFKKQNLYIKHTATFFCHASDANWRQLLTKYKVQAAFDYKGKRRPKFWHLKLLGMCFL